MDLMKLCIKADYSYDIFLRKNKKTIDTKTDV